jgi:hypothetical protein
MGLVKKAGTALVVLVISSIVFYIFIKDKQFKNDLLRTTLSAFGDQLLAMVPAGEEKISLEKKYQDFLQQADNNKIPEEKIEKVAATILNLSNQDTVISAQDAIAMLDLDAPQEVVSTPVPLESLPEEYSVRLSKPTPLPETWQRQDREKLAKKLSQMRELHFQISCLSPAIPTKDKIVFSADSGLRVTLSTELKMAINNEANPTLERNIQNLENQKLLAWQIRIPDSILSDVNNYLQYIPSEVQNYIPGDAKKVLAILGSINIDSLSRANPDSLKNILKIQFQIKQR